MGARYAFVLGAPNDDDGTLSPISLSRIEAAVALQAADETIVTVATGGFGSHFNRTSTAHRIYVEAELARRGARVADTLPDQLLSANTVEDAVMIDAFATTSGIDRIDIVTSAFHLSRCRFIFDCLMPMRKITFHAAVDPAGVDPIILAHEDDAQARLVAQGGVMIDGQLRGKAP